MSDPPFLRKEPDEAAATTAEARSALPLPPPVPFPMVLMMLLPVGPCASPPPPPPPIALPLPLLLLLLTLLPLLGLLILLLLLPIEAPLGAFPGGPPVPCPGGPSPQGAPPPAVRCPWDTYKVTATRRDILGGLLKIKQAGVGGGWGIGGDNGSSTALIKDMKGMLRARSRPAYGTGVALGAFSCSGPK